MSMKDKSIAIIIIILMVAVPIIAMGKSIYISLAVISILSIIAIYKYKFLIITILIIINERIFYLIEDNIIPQEAINVALVISIVIICVFVMKFRKNKQKFYFNICIILFSIIPFISSITANVLNNQDLVMGISASKRYFIYLIYVYLITVIKDKYDIYKIEKIMMYLGTILSVFFLIQSLISLDIFKIVAMDSRTGGMRFFQGYSFIMFCYLISLCKVFDKNTTKKETSICLLFCFTQVISIIVVSQTRNFIISILVATFFVVLFQKKYKKILLVCIFVFFTGIFILSGIELNIGFIELIKSTIYDMKNGVGTIGFRLEEIQYYMHYFITYPIFGMGDYNNKFYYYNDITGLYLRFYTVDVGIIGYMFNFGIIGVLIFAILIVKLFKIIINLRDNRNMAYNLSVAFLGFIAGGLTSTFYIQDSNSILYVSIVLVIIEFYYKDSLKENGGA